MKEQEQHIEKLFKDAFETFEAEVAPNAWSNIQKGLPQAGASAAAATKLSIITKTLLSVAVVSAGIWMIAEFASKDETKEYIVTDGKDFTIAKEIQPFSDEFVNVDLEIEQENTSSASQPVNRSKSVKEEISEKVEQKDYSKGRYSHPQYSGRDFAGRPYQDSNYHYTESLEDDLDETIINSELKNSDEAEREVDVKKKNDVEVSGDVEKLGLTQEQIPNIFTPNFDGQNDFFILPTEKLSSIQVIIYDRNGKLVNKWDQLDGSWDGRTFNGQLAPSGGYIYEIRGIDKNNKSCNYRGFITLKR